MAATSKIVLVVEYDGTAYCGFQWQKDQPTVQKEIEEAIRRLTGEEIRIIAASRTDSGVHARGQVVSFRTRSAFPSEAFVGGMNYNLPGDIAVREAYRVDNSLDIRRQALSREYKYYILNSMTRSPWRKGFSCLVRGRLDINAMNEACRVLLGEHDFISFASSIEKDRVRSTRRTVYHAGVAKEEELTVFRIVANSFLTHQVRNTVGALLKVGSGRMSSGDFRRIMEEKRQALAGPAAPACGLCLVKVNYQYSFEEVSR
ncbi:MAG: tRNA pseudouridine(38-40) synthase TruA [Chloroflexota bacterium]